MKDSSFQYLLDRLSTAKKNYDILLESAEKEYKKRFGNYPSDVDDDSWIDTFHIVGGKMTVKEVGESAKKRIGL